MSDLFIIAEMGASHNGSLETALKIVHAAKEAGADVIKLQTWTPDTMAIPGYVIESGLWKGRELQDLYRQAHLPWEWHPLIFEESRRLGIECFSTPFDKQSVDFLETLNCPRYKIASFENTDVELIRYVISKEKPVIISTGTATDKHIMALIYLAAYELGIDDLVLMHCVSKYPAHIEEANLTKIRTIPWRIMGISDHSPGSIVPVMAIALGATVVEKHITLERHNGALDNGFAMEPHEFKQMVHDCRLAYQAIQPRVVAPSDLRRSLYYSQDLPKGTILKREHFKTARPALGAEPREMESLIGRELPYNVKTNTPVSTDILLTQLDPVQ